jgi:hypothetical protein
MLPKVSPSKTASIWVFLIQGKKSWTLLLILNNKNKVHIFLCMKTKVNAKIEQHVPDEKNPEINAVVPERHAAPVQLWHS